MRFLPIILIAALIGCSSTEKTQPPAATAKTFGVVISKKDQPLTGKNYMFAHKDASVELIPNQEKLIAYFKEKSDEKLKAQGFEVVKEYRKSHLSGFSFVNQPAAEDERVPESMKAAARAKDLYELSFGLFVREYGVRGKELFRVRFIGSKDAFNDEAEMKQKIDEVVAQLDYPAPEKNNKMKGDPSCTPRFGYDVSNILSGKTDGYYVTTVDKDGAAGKAGLKVDDKIVSINGVPYAEMMYAQNDGKFRSNYESKKASVFKIERAAQVFDLKVKPKMNCEF